MMWYDVMWYDMIWYDMIWYELRDMMYCFVWCDITGDVCSDGGHKCERCKRQPGQGAIKRSQFVWFNRSTRLTSESQTAVIALWCTHKRFYTAIFASSPTGLIGARLARSTSLEIQADPYIHSSSPSIVPLCASQQYRHYSGNRRYSARYHPG